MEIQLFVAMVIYKYNITMMGPVPDVVSACFSSDIEKSSSHITNFQKLA